MANFLVPRPLVAYARACRLWPKSQQAGSPTAALVRLLYGRPLLRAWLTKLLAAATSFLVWDVLITLDDEVKLVWARPNSFRAKWLFLFVRHFAVALQIALIFVGTDVAAQLHYTPRACTIWYIFPEFSTQALIASVEIVLILRVQALYHQKAAIRWLLQTLFIVENTCMIVALVFAVHGAVLDSTCLATHASFGIIYFGAAYGSFETLLVVLTLIKFISSLREGWGRTPVLTILFRDGTWAFALVFGRVFNQCR